MKRGALRLTKFFQPSKSQLIGEDTYGNKYYDNGYCF